MRDTFITAGATHPQFLATVKATNVESYDLAGKTIERRHTIPSDEPSELFGTNTAPNPQDLLLAALNACMMVGFVVAATARGIRIDALEIESAADFDLRGAFGIDPSVAPGAPRIPYTIRVKGDATMEQFEEIRSRDVRDVSEPVPPHERNRARAAPRGRLSKASSTGN